jgi:hypothetical protein
MIQPNHVLRASLLFLCALWLAYTFFKQAIDPPKDNSSRWHLESYAVNNNLLVRILNVLVGILVLVIAFSLTFGR